MSVVFLSVQRYDWCTPLSHPSSCVLVNHGPSQQSFKEKYNHGNEVLPQNTTHIIQRPCYQWGNLCQDPACNWTTWRPPDHHKRHKLKWCGHVSHSSGLAKTILQGTIKGGRRQGRQRERWEDNIREWTGLEFAKSHRAVENRKNMGEAVCKVICGAQRLMRLRDRWGEEV